MASKPHALCIPMLGLGHINAMLKLANLLHFRGFHITFVNPEFGGVKFLVLDGSGSLDFQPGFRFETISDAPISPKDDNNSTSSSSSSAAILDSIETNGVILIQNLINKLNSSSDPPVSCIVWDCLMSSFLEFTQSLDIPQVVFWSMSAAVLMIYLHTTRIVEEAGLFQENNEELMDMHIDFIPGLRNLRLKDLPSYFWDGNEVLQNLMTQQVERTLKAPTILLHTFDELEGEVLQVMKPLLPPVYTIGPLNFLEQQSPNEELKSFRSNLFKENQECLEWLNSQAPNSVVYVNFGSTTTLTRAELTEFAWGLASCGHPFLWIVRTDLVIGDDAALPRDFLDEIADRSMICSWCPQEKVLNHSSTGVFLTHSGWNSIMDTMCAGVPVINWPFFVDQQTNCWSTCTQWGIGMEIGKDIKRDDVKRLIGEMMEGVKANEMRKNAMNWKWRARESTQEGGSSYENLELVIKEVLLQKNS